MQELELADHVMRRTYPDCCSNNIVRLTIFRIESPSLVSTHFAIGGYVNKQNRRVWGEFKSRRNCRKTFVSKKEVTQAVNSYRSSYMIIDFFDLKLNIWMRKNVVSTGRCHKPYNVSCFSFFVQGSVISRIDNVNWPPRSCSLPPLNFILWDYAKSRIYATVFNLLTLWKRTSVNSWPSYCSLWDDKSFKIISQYYK